MSIKLETGRRISVWPVQMDSFGVKTANRVVTFLAASVPEPEQKGTF